MSPLMRYVFTSVVTFFVLFAIVRIVFSVFFRDVEFGVALTSMDTWGPVIIGSLIYALFIYLVNRKRFENHGG